jgi:hypothetical protein
VNLARRVPLGAEMPAVVADRATHDLPELGIAGPGRRRDEMVAA